MKYTASLFIILLSLAACHPRKKGKIYSFSSVGWSITVPDRYAVEDSTRLNTYGPPVAGSYNYHSLSKALISVYDIGGWRLNGANLRVVIEPAPQNSSGELKKHIQKTIGDIASLVLHSDGKSKLDTTFSTEKIDGQLFQKQTYKLPYDKSMLTIVSYSAIRNNYFFDAVITYLDDNGSDRFFDLWRDSEFKN